MAGYEYNPLLKLDLQKRSAVSPADIEHIEEEITTINGDLKNKVPKFFTSIEELQIGEIGQYQGDTTDTFVHGYFYQRGTGTTEMVVVDDETLSPTYYVDLTLLADSSQSVRLISNVERSNALYHGGVSVYYDMPNGDEVEIFGFPENNPYIKTTRLMPIMNPLATTPWYAMPKAFNYTQNKWVDFEVEITGSGNWDWSVTIEGETPQQISGGGFEAYVHKLYYPYPDLGYVPCLAIGRRNGVYVHPMPIDLPFVMQLDGLWFFRVNAFLFDPLVFYHYILDSFTYHSFNYVESPSIERVDAQPSLDPTDFATAAQGEKADTALQSIEKGTDGNYITTTVGTKDANNNQTVGVSAKIQDIATAGNDNKGFAESSNVKAYAATAAQGAKADTALQSISHGTDGNYVTSHIGTKDANNVQTVDVSLQLQAVESADVSHKGVAEANDVKEYVAKSIASYIPYNPIYGVMWDTSDPSPECVRIGNLDLHRTLPVQSQMVGGTLTDAGVFTPFASVDDWTTETRDGSAGQVMVRLPQFWIKYITEGTVNKVLMSANEVGGFKKVPVMYVSAYKAALQRSTLKLASVVNTDADFRGGNNQSAWDGTYRSLLGYPATSISLTDFRTYARNRAAGTEWNCAVYEIHKLLYWLFVVEYATLNTQKDYNAALDANGYHQGGLGVGVTDWSGDAWNSFNGYYPLIPCGHTDEYGNQTAQKQYNLYDSDGTTILLSFQVPRYRGVESPFGDIWEWTDGVLIPKQADSNGGKSPVYVTSDPANFSSTDYSLYDYVCDEIRSEAFVKSIYFGNNGDLICTATPGSSTSYYCDYWYGANLPSSGVAVRALLFGGAANYGARAGFVCGHSRSGPGYVFANIGSRLCFIPNTV